MPWSPRRAALTLPIAAAVGIGCALLGIGSSPVLAEDQPAPPPPSKDARFFALLVGCTEYPVLRERYDPAYYAARVRLQGCANDVALWEQTLVARGVLQANITKLVGGSSTPAASLPTRANIVAALEQFERMEPHPGDRLLVAYSGHGVQVADDNRDEADGRDEAWLPADAGIDPVSKGFTNVLRDDEIGERLRRIRDRGVLVWLVADCCHSATGMRGTSSGGSEGRTRTLDTEVLGGTLPEPPSRGIGGLDPTVMGGSKDTLDGIVAFYAAQSEQAVPEIRVDAGGALGAESLGLLTFSVIRGLRLSGGDLTFGELHEAVRAGYQYVGTSHKVQSSAEGDLALRVFGTRAGAVPGLEVERGAGGDLEVTAGALVGLERGTELSVFQPTRRGDASARVGTVVLTEVGVTSSRCQVVGPSDAWARGGAALWPAEVARIAVGDTRLKITVMGRDGKPVDDASRLPEAVRTVFQNVTNRAFFPLFADPAQADWLVFLDGSDALESLAPARRGPGSVRFPVRRADELEKMLGRIRRAENLLRLSARLSATSAQPSVRVEGFQIGPGNSEELIRPGSALTPGTPVRFRLTNLSRQAGLAAQDVYVFYLDPLYGVSILFPFGDARQRVGPRLTSADPASIDILETSLTDESLGVERLLVFSVPKRKEARTLNLDFLEQEPLEASQKGPARGAGAPPDPVADLLGDLAFGGATTRGSPPPVDRSAGDFRVSVLSWETAWGALRMPSPVAGAPAARVEPSATAKPPASGPPPDAWALGAADVSLAQSAAGAWCLLLAHGADADQVFIGLTKEVPADQRTPTGVAALAKGAFDAEIALRFEANRAVAWYDTDDNGVFDFVLVDADRDGRAEERWTLRGGAWSMEPGLGEPLLSTEHCRGLFSTSAARLEAIRRLASLAAPFASGIRPGDR